MIALTRVVLWHAFGAPVLSYVVAAVPAMFFVTGDLLAASTERRSPGKVVVDRLGRLLLPFWGFGIATWCALIISPGLGSASAGWRTAAWIVPFTDPPGSGWAGGWLTSALWYLRAYVWLLLVAPLLLACIRRWPRGLVIAGIAATLTVELAARTGRLAPPWAPTLGWKLGDLALYGTFLSAGMAHRAGVLRGLRPRTWLWVALTAAAAALLWRLSQPVPRGVVNNSQPLHMLVGAAWLAVALAFRQPLTGLARRAPVSAALRLFGRRSLTIYLWHPACILLALAVLGRRPPAGRGTDEVVYVALIVSGLAVAIGAAGWLEDVAARRRPQLWPGHLRGRRRQLIASFAPALVVLTSTTVAAFSAPSQTANQRISPPLPSQQPPPLRFTSRKPAVVARPAAEILDQWLRQTGASGVAAGLLTGDGQMWMGAAGRWPDGRGVKADDTFDIQSTTKLFTAWLVYNAAQDGLIDLDGALPHLPSAPVEQLPSGLTPRLLLAHRSGLVNYRDTVRYHHDPATIATPAEAIQASLSEPALEPPDTASRYSSVNYLLLGELLEQVTGHTFSELLGNGFNQIGTGRATHAPPRPGEPNQATAGIAADTGDLLVAGRSILRDRLGLTEASVAAMTTFDVSSGIGAGALAICPCELDSTGRPLVFAYGYTGGATMLEYIPTADRVVVIQLAESLYEGDRYMQATQLLVDLAVAWPA